MIAIESFRITVFRLVLTVLFCQTANAQLDNFTLSVNVTNETCTANGSLNFVVENTTSGAAMLYSVFQLPNTTTPIAVLSANTLTGLSAGNYRVVATQSLGVESASKQQDVSILDQIVDLEYTVAGVNEICGNDGKITVNVTAGTGFQYEIIAGPEIRPLQTSNVFDDLPSGTYTIRVFDICGEGLVRTFTLGEITPAFSFETFEDLLNCTTLDVSGYLMSGGQFIIKYPVTIVTTVPQPSGPPLVFNHTIANGQPGSAPFSFNLPITPGQTFLAHFEATDGCGNVFTDDIPLAAPPMFIYPQMLGIMEGCNNFRLQLSFSDEVNPVTISFLNAPPGFDPALWNVNHPGPFFSQNTQIHYYNPSIPLPAGTYTVQVTDACGQVAVRSVTVTYETNPGNTFSSVLPGCEPGMGSLQITCTNSIVSAQLLSAPAAYPVPTPQNVTAFITTGGIQMGNLPPGTYSFSFTDDCNFTYTKSATVIGYQQGDTNVAITPHCDSFDFSFTHTDNLQFKIYWLQKRNPATNLWGHPVTGFTGSQTNITATNALYLNNNLTPTIQTSGTFRLIKTFNVFGQDAPCLVELETFEYTIGPKIAQVYSIGCSNGTYTAIVEGTGYAPLIYRITTKNGQPFVIDNGGNALFSNLDPAIYNFQIEDACGNILNSVFEVSSPVPFTVEPTGLCQGQPGQLAVPGFSFLTYQWWKEGDPDTILSTTNILSFPNLTASDAGIYHVRVIYPGQETCVDFVVDFTVSPALGNPQAGNDSEITYCGPQGLIDLSGLLTGTFDNFGDWEELTNSNTLSGSVWNSNVPAGVFEFKYKVSGFCNATDEALLTITILDSIQNLTATANQPVCQSGTIELTASDISGASYQWTGPNGFSSTIQNPTITNATIADAGVYTVTATIGGCASNPASVTASVSPIPEFSITPDCVQGNFVLSATMVSPAFDQNQLVFDWSGPENFSAVGNPITITGLPAGVYSLSVTTADGCNFTSEQIVETTLCGIPSGVSPNDDGNNDSWNLTGLDVQRVKIFNRYGMLMYEKAAYANEWNGQDKHGCELPSATYYYLIELAGGEARSGWVYLMRDH